ncbi:MAG TPA: hypothetical protein VGF48_05790 [Thermoanaerobaculia bacterium]
MTVVEACMRIIWEARYAGGVEWWALENPVGHLRRFLGRPSFTFQPWHFGDRYSKQTDIWGYFERPAKKRGARPLSKFEEYLSRRNIRSLPTVEGMKLTRADRRAITPPGFAKAFFKANP